MRWARWPKQQQQQQQNLAFFPIYWKNRPSHTCAMGAMGAIGAMGDIFSIHLFLCPNSSKNHTSVDFFKIFTFFINNVKLSALWSIDYGSFHSCCLTHCQRTLSIWPREDAERRTVLSTEPFSKPDRSMTERSSWQNGLFLEDAFRANLAVRVLISE